MIDHLDLVQFETTSACPARCVFCPHKDQKRPHGMMSIDLIHKIIRETDAYGVKEIMPFLNGEPFADHRLFDILSFIKENTKLKVGIYTNIHLATKGKLELLLDEYSDILSYLEVSWNGVTPEKRLALTGLDKFDEDLNKVGFLQGQYEARKCAFPLVIGMVGTPEARPDFPEFQRMFGNYARLYKYFNWAGKIGAAIDRPTNMLCNRILHHMTILWDGRLALCCMDNEGAMDIGDVKGDTIGNIWESFQPMRTAHKQGYFMNLCKVCNME